MGCNFPGRAALRTASLVGSLLVCATAAFGQRLPAGVRPEHYDLAFDVDLARARFSGVETIRVQVEASTNRVVLNAVDLTFKEVTIDSGGGRQRATVRLGPQMAVLTVARTLAAGPATIHITYDGILNDTLRGFYLSRANGRRYAVSQMESTDARRAFPCFDEPAFKATFAVALTIDAADSAISNGRVIADTPGPGAGRHTVRFSTSPKMSSYLVALAVGDFTCLEGLADRVPVRVCATPDKVQLGRLALESAEAVVGFYNRYFDIKYPFEKIDLVAVPDFSAGAMENTAAIFYRETDLLADEATASVDTRKRIASVLAHEMAHQWFGDLVTMAWWDDLWLNEGFATWMENRPLGAWKPEWNIPVDDALATQAALDLDGLAATRAIHSVVETPGEIEASFDAIAYQKGGAVLRMVEGFVGSEAFRTGINAYLAKYAYANATSQDFWTVMTAATGQPLDQILSTFVNQPGAPLLSVTAACGEPGARSTGFSLARFSSGPPTAGRGAAALTTGQWAVPVCAKGPAVVGEPGCRVIRGGRSAGDVPGAAPLRCPSPPWLFANAGATGYYRTEYPSTLIAALAPEVETRLTAPERVSLIGDEWALVRAGRHGIGDFLTLASGFGRESSSGVMAQLARRLTDVRSYLTTAPTRPTFDAFLQRVFAPLAAELGPNTLPGEPTDRTALRAEVLALLGEGGAPAALAQARHAVDDALAGRAPLDPATARAQVELVAQHGDVTDFERFLDASRRAVSPEERYRYLYALARIPDRGLAERGLALTLTAEIRGQDTPTFIGRYLANPETGAVAWRFLKTHWDALGPKALNFLGDAYIASALGAFCDAPTRDDIAAFFKTRPLPSGGRALSQSLARIDSCVAFKRAQGDALTAWLTR